MESRLDRHRERFRAEPGDDRAFAALEEHYFLNGGWEDLIAIYQHRLSAPASKARPRERAEVLFRLGQVCEERLEDVDRAVGCYEEVLRTDSNFRPALSQLRSIHASRARWEVALQIAEVEAALPLAPGERATLLAQMGTLWLEHLNEPEQASAHFERALADDPENQEALEGAARSFEACGKPAEAASAWERLIELLSGPARPPALLALARLAAASLGQPDRAEELYRRALTDDPRNPEALEGLSTRAAEREQWPLLAELQERRFEVAADGPQRAQIAVEAGRLRLEQLHDPQGARMWLSRASELGCEDVRVYEALVDLEREHGDDEALLRYLERVAELRGDTVPVSVLLEVASLRSERGDDERALQDLERALERAPDDALVAEALSDTLSRLGRTEELADLLERRAALAVADPAARAAVLAELGALYEECLNDPDATRHAYERAFQADPSAPGVAHALERVYRKAESWDALRALLEEAGRSGPPEERARFLCSLGTLLAERFDDQGGAVRALEAALTIDPASPVAHRGLQRLARATGDDERVLHVYEREASVTTDRGRLASLVSELTQILERLGRPDAALEWAERWAAAAPESVEALGECARLHEKLHHDAALVATLERLDLLVQSRERATIRRRLGALHSARGRREQSIAAYRAALEADPEDLEALEALVAQLEKANRLEELAQARRNLAELLPPPRRAQCLDELATLLADRVGDLGGAIDALARLENEEGALPDVGQRLEALLERAERYEELAARLLESKRTLPADSPEAVAIDLRRARLLLDRLGRFDAAAAAYREVRSRDPASAEALEGLERALRGARDIAGLAAVLAERAETEADPEARERCAFERAVLLEESLEAGEEAREAYRRLVASAADATIRSEASSRLEALLTRSGSWAALREHLEASLDEGGDVDARALHQRLGRLCRDHLGDPSGAISHFEAVARIEPGWAEPWRDLARLYEQANRTEDLVRALEAELAAGPEPERELSLCSRAAELCASALAEPGRARAHYERALELDPAHSAAAEFLAEHWERSGRPDLVVRVLEKRLDRLEAAAAGDEDQSTLRISLRVRIAGLRAGRLDDLDGAIAALEPAVGEAGPRAVVAEPLADLYQRAGYWSDLIELCRSAATACDEPGERANWLVRLGDTLRQHGRDREATEAYCRALTDRPDDREVQAALRELYRRLGESEPLARLLEAELTRLAGSEEIPARMELARVLAGPLCHLSEALVQLRRVLQIEPSHAEALALALELTEQLNDTEAILGLVDAALARPQPPTVRVELLARRGRLLARTPGRLDEAALAYRDALALDPTQRALRREFAAILESQGRWDAVLDCLFEEACGADAESRARLFERAADLAREHLSLEASLPWLERLRRERPRDAAVAARIAEVHRRAGRREALLRALDNEIALTADAPRQRDLHVERARILELELDSPGRAVAALEAARAACPDDPEVLGDLDRLYRTMGNPRERVGVLEALLADAEGPERVALLCEAASLYAGPLADPHRAAVHLRTAVAAVPQGSSMRAELLRALGDALRRAGPPDAWARCAEEELGALDSEAPVFADRRREIRRDLAHAYERELGRPGAALRHLRALVDAPVPEDDGAEGEALGAAYSALLRLLRRAGNWVELEERLAGHLEREPEDLEGWLELARLRDEWLQSPAAAMDAYRRVIEREPDCLPAIRGLRSAAERLADWAEVANTLERELEHPQISSPGERSALLRRLGDLCWHRLQSTTRASRSYAAALEANPRDFESLRSLQRLLEAMEDWRGALDLYESEIEVLGEGDLERRKEVWLRAGELARDRTGETERARHAFARAAALGPLPAARRAELAELHLQRGDLGSFAQVFAAWCDDPAAEATSADHVRLAETLEQLGRIDPAASRIERALAVDERHAPAWDAAARLRQAQGDVAGAVEALGRAADLVTDADAAPRLLRAAELAERRDPERAAALLRSAAQRDPGAASVQAALARVAARLGEHAEAEGAAGRALDLAAASGSPDPGFCLEVALIGGRSARAEGRSEAAARFFAAALSVEPEHSEALGGYGEALADQGDLTGARQALEARIDGGEAYPERAGHLAILGRCLQAAGDARGARERLEAALDEDPRLDEVHQRLVELHEAADRLDEGIACLERWADTAAEPADRAQSLLRAAEWELRAGNRHDSAERHLRDALDADPTVARSWQALATLLWERGRPEEVLEVTTQALAGIDDAADRAPLALVQGRALEIQGERRQAAEAFGAAAEADPRNVEAVLSSARLLRGLGEWNAAAAALRDFANRHPGDDPLRVAEVLTQLGRLLAGPLEDVEGAISVYRMAIEMDPERTEACTALAEFLSHRPEDWDEAIALHRTRLEADPAHAPSLRMLLRIARDRGQTAVVSFGLHILRALGAASPHELEEVRGAPPPVFAGERPELADPLWEKVRQVANESARQIADALEASGTPDHIPSDKPDAAFRSAVLSAEGRLTAPALLPLTHDELGEVLTLIAALVLEPDQVRGDGRLVNAMSAALPRRSRRRLRRLLGDASLEAIAQIDFAAWRREVRALATATALDETGRDLRAVLSALVSEQLAPPARELSETADLTPLVANSPEALALLRLTVRTWLRHI